MSRPTRDTSTAPVHAFPYSRPLRIGTRGSPLARAQTALAVARLQAVFPGLPEPEIHAITTTGDRVTDRPLYDIGGKGLFAKEIDQALVDGRIDLAIHSVKDVETWLPDGIVLAAALPRADARDALISPAATAIAGLPAHGRVATGSVRRTAQLRALRPDLEIVPLRGNVNTRLAKLRDGLADATLLAMAGIVRLGLDVPEATPLAPAEFLPAAGQGIVTIACREDAGDLRLALAAADDRPTAIAMAAERAALAALDGSCRTPIGAHATVAGDRVSLDVLVALHDGSEVFRTSREGPAADAAALGTDAGAELRRRAPDSLFAEV